MWNEFNARVSVLDGLVSKAVSLFPCNDGERERESGRKTRELANHQWMNEWIGDWFVDADDNNKEEELAL